MKMRFVVRTWVKNGDKEIPMISEIFEVDVKKTKDGKFSQATCDVLSHIMDCVDKCGDQVTIEKVGE